MFQVRRYVCGLVTEYAGIRRILRICFYNNAHGRERERERECVCVYMCVRECVSEYVCVHACLSNIKNMILKSMLH